MKCDLSSGSTYGAVQYAQNSIILLEMMQLSGLVGLVESSEWSVFRTEVQKIAPGYIMKSRDGMSTGFLFSAILVLFGGLFFFFWELIRKSLFQIKCGLSCKSTGFHAFSKVQVWVTLSISLSL